jgi:hypothetical protein
MADNKTKPTKVSVTAFVDGLEPSRRLDAKAIIN